MHICGLLILLHEYNRSCKFLEEIADMFSFFFLSIRNISVQLTGLLSFAQLPGAKSCTQCKGTGVNSVDHFNGQFKAGGLCWLCR